MPSRSAAFYIWSCFALESSQHMSEVILKKVVLTHFTFCSLYMEEKGGVEQRGQEIRSGCMHLCETADEAGSQPCDLRHTGIWDCRMYSCSAQGISVAVQFESVNQFYIRAFMGCHVCVLRSQNHLLKFLALQNQPESLAPGSASVQLALRCCSCVCAGKNIRQTYCQIRLAIAFSHILALPLNTFAFPRMFLYSQQVQGSTPC